MKQNWSSVDQRVLGSGFSSECLLSSLREDCVRFREYQESKFKEL